MVGRLSMGALGLLLILLTHERTGSFGAGGAVAAASALGFAFGAPVLGRLVDRRGQAGVLVAGALLHSAGFVSVALLPHDAPLALAMAGAALAGAGYPPLSSSMRAVWNDRLDSRSRYAAFSIDAVAGELTYIAGPLLLVGAVGAWSFQAAAITGSILTVLGTLLYTSTRAVRGWEPRGGNHHGRLGALRSPGIVTLVGVAVLFGIAVAAIELGVAAFAEHEHAKGATGFILGLWGAGSMLGGIWAARRGPGEDPVRTIAIMLGGVALTTAPLAVAPDLWALGALIVVAGFFIAPALAVAWALAADLAPYGTVTEASTWMGTGMGAGIAAGGAISGQLVEAYSPAAGFLLAAAFVLVAAALVAVRRPQQAILAT
jgi:MFS family permease